MLHKHAYKKNCQWLGNFSPDTSSQWVRAASLAANINGFNVDNGLDVFKNGCYKTRL